MTREIVRHHECVKSFGIVRAVYEFDVLVQYFMRAMHKQTHFNLPDRFLKKNKVINV